MKRHNTYLFIIMICFFQRINAQSVNDKVINFQGIARNIDGSILANKAITVRLSLLEGATTGIIKYQEIKTVTTNVVGLFTIVLGEMELNKLEVIGPYSSVDWSIDNKYLQVEIDPNNSIVFNLLGIQKINYVPYAIHSNSTIAANIIGTVPINKGGTGVSSISAFKKSINIDKVDNTPDINKPVSAFQQTLFDTKMDYFDTLHIYNKLDLKLAISDTISLSNRINNKISGVDTIFLSDRINKKLSLIDTLTLSNRIDQKLSNIDTIHLSDRIDLKENTLNKSSDINLDAISDSKYPSVKAVKSYVDASIPATATYPITLSNGGTGANNSFDARANLGLVIGTNVLAQRNFGTAASSNINDFEPAIATGLSTQYWKGDKSWQTLNTDAVNEGAKLYHTDSRARAAISLTNTGTSGAATYDIINGILNIPIYPVYTPATILLSGDVTGSGTSSITTTIGSGKVMNDMLAGNIDLTNKVANILPITNGGTGSSTKNYVDLSTTQTINGKKTFDTLLSNSLQKIGGTPNQFLKADGSVDANTYGIRFDTLYMNRNILRNSSTGVLTFGGLTLNGGLTAFNIGAVTGVIVDNTTDPDNPVITYVKNDGATGITDPYLTTSNMTYILLDISGNIIYQSTIPTTQQRRQNIYLGKLTHTERDGFYVNAYTQADIVYSPASQLRDIWDPIHLVNGGVYPSANGVNLNLNTSAGTIYGLGVGWVANPLSPSTLPVDAKIAANFKYRTQTGGVSSYVTLIDPTRYDLNGVITLVGTTTRATNQRIYILQNGEIRVQYGQTYYSSLANAIAGIQTETFITFPNFKDNGILIGVLSVRQNATDLSNIAQAQFFLVSKFGELVGASSGVTTGTLQQGYNNSGSPQITTNGTNLALTIQRGSTADTDKVLDIKNGGAVSKFSVTGEGTVATTGLTFGEKTMKIDFASCAASGTINTQSGNGITMTHTLGTGVYIIGFSESNFTLAPIATATLNSLGLIKATAIANSVTVSTYDLSGVPTDLDFSLISIFYK